MQGWALCVCVQTGFTQHVQGMQGLGVLALVVVAPCGARANRSPWNPPPSWGSQPLLWLPSSPYTPPPTLSCNQGPWSTPLSTAFPSSLTRICSVPGACPYHLPPRNRSPWTPPEPLYPPPPHRASFKKRHFSFLTSKIRRRFAKFAPSLGPMPLPPTPPEPKPLDPPPPSPCTPPPATKALGLHPCPPGQLRWVPPPHPTGHPSKKRHFSFFLYALETQKYDTSCEICSVPGARAPTTYPPGTKALGPALPEPLPRQANLGPRGSQPSPNFEGPWSTPLSTRPAPVGTPPHEMQGGRSTPLNLQSTEC